MDTYVAAHQDKSKNALSKAMEASFVAWGEELKADQAQFCSEKVSTLDYSFRIVNFPFWVGPQKRPPQVSKINC